jgi:hypothetical protein
MTATHVYSHMEFPTSTIDHLSATGTLVRAVAFDIECMTAELDEQADIEGGVIDRTEIVWTVSRPIGRTSTMVTATARVHR